MKKGIRAADGRRFTQIKHGFLIRVHLRLSAAISILLCCGCSPYLQAQIDLAEQSRKGVAMISQSLDAKQATIQRFQQAQRLRIDGAFDADVREQETLTSDWVIDHRRAYAVALDALNEQSNRLQLSHENDQKTLAAMDLALQKLEWLSSIPMQSGGTP
jgi:hypothetical protein